MGRRVHGAGRRGLGQAPALEDRDADAAVEVAQPGSERGAAGHRPGDASAEGGTELGVDELVEQPVLQPQRQRGATGVERRGVVDGDLLGAVEDLALAVPVRLLLGRVVDLLEHPRHRQDERRLEGGEVRQQVLDVRAVTHAGAALDAGDLDQPGEDVGQREEQQRRALFVEQLGEHERGAAAGAQQRAVGELAALGSSGRAGGVDDRGEGVPGDGRAAGRQVGGGHVAAGRGQLLQAAGVDLPDPGEVRQPAADLVEGRLVGRGLEQQGHGARVPEVPLHLLGGGRLVDGDRDGAGGPDRVVAQRPLVPRLAHQPDPVAGADAAGHQTGGQRGHLGRELLRRHRRPAAVDLAGEHDGVRCARRPRRHGVGQRRVRGQLEHLGGGVLLHWGSSRGSSIGRGTISLLHSLGGTSGARPAGPGG